MSDRSISQATDVSVRCLGHLLHGSTIEKLQRNMRDGCCFCMGDARHPNAFITVQLNPARRARLTVLVVQRDRQRERRATELLARVTQVLEEIDVVQIYAQYLGGGPLDASLSPFLMSQGFSAPRPIETALKCAIPSVETPWIQKWRKLRPGFHSKPWNAEAAEVARDVCLQQRMPCFLHPQRHYEPHTSLALYEEDRLIGWAMTERITPDTLRCQQLYVVPGPTHRGLGIAMLAAGIYQQHLHLRDKVKFAYWETDIHNGEMQRLLRRRLAPHTVWERPILLSQKNLDEQACC